MNPLAPIAQLLALDQVLADPNQPRKAFDEVSLGELAASIKADGLLQPIVVKPNGKGFYIVDGERRFRAAKAAGLKEVPVIVRADLKDQDVTALQLVANIQREDLTLPEQCDAVTRLVKSLNGPDGKGGQEKAAAKLGKSVAWVSKRAGLVSAPAEVRALLNKGQVVDAEVAAGIVELMQVADPKSDTVKQVLERAKDPEYWDGPLTRDQIRDEIRNAKDEVKRKEESAKQAAKTRKAIAEGKAKPDPYAEQQRKEREQKAERNRKWGLLNPALKKFAAAVQEVIGGRVSGPSHQEYYPSAPPASVAAATFQIGIEGSADQLQKIVSRTGLTLKLEASHDFPNVTPDQAKKIEQIIGKAVRWYDRVDLDGEKLAKLTAKCGKAIEIPDVNLSKPATAAAAVKSGTKKAAKKKR